MVFLIFNELKGVLIEPVQPIRQTPLLVEEPERIEQCIMVELHFVVCCRDEQDLVDNEPTGMIFRSYHPLQDFEESRFRVGIQGARIASHFGFRNLLFSCEAGGNRFARGLDMAVWKSATCVYLDLPFAAGTEEGDRDFFQNLDILKYIVLS